MAIKHPFHSAVADGTDSSLVRPSNWNADHTIEAGSIAHSDLTGLASGDDHTQYQKESEKGAANGYASLDSGILVPIAQLPVAAPTIALATSAAAGAASTIIRSDATIAAFDATAPVTQAFSDAAATGSAPFAARRDHKHGMPASPGGGGGGGLGFFGDGSDGALVYDGAATILGMAPAANVYTLTRDILATDLTVNVGITIKTNGWRVFASGTLLNNGTIHNDGAAASGNTGGAGAGIGSATSLGRGTDGGGGSVPSGTTTVGGINGTGPGVSPGAHPVGGTGGAGGNGNGGPGGTLTTVAGARVFRDAASAISQVGIKTATNAAGASVIYGLVGGAGGGEGGRTTGGTATVSGGGGGGGGVLVVAAKTITNTSGIIRCNGGAGAAATGGTCVTGGGGGGGGGALFLVYNTLSAGTETANGGALGAGLNGASAAVAGSAGVVVKIANA